MNILLHTLNSLLLFVFFWRISGSRKTSLYGSIIFFLHPAALEAAAIFYSPLELVSASLFITALIVCSGRDRKSYILLIPVIVFFSIKLSALAAAVIIIIPLYDRIVRQKTRYFLYILCIAAWFLASTLENTPNDTGEPELWILLLSIVKVYAQHLKQLLLPIPFTADKLTLSHYTIEPVVLNAMIILMAYLLVIEWSLREEKNIFFFLIFILLCLGPVSVKLFHLKDYLWPAALKEGYLPAAGAAYIASSCLALLHNKKMQKFVLFCALCYYMAGYAYSRSIPNSSVSISYQARRYPEDTKILSLLAEQYLVEFQPKRAITVAKEVSDREPGNPGARDMLAHAYVSNAEFDRALEEFRIEEGLNPECMSCLYNSIGMVYQLKGEYKEALDAHRKSLSIDPGLAITHHFMGEIYEQMNQKGDAIEEYETALKMNPDFEDTRQRLVQLLISSGKEDRAAYHQKMKDSRRDRR